MTDVADEPAADGRPGRRRSIARRAISLLWYRLTVRYHAPPDSRSPSATALVAVHHVDSVALQCDVTCYSAVTSSCRGCICDGLNHGVGREQAEINTREHGWQWGNRAMAADQSIVAADVLSARRYR